MGEDGLFKQELIDKVTGKCETHNNKRRMKSRDDLLGEKYWGASELIALNRFEMQMSLLCLTTVACFSINIRVVYHFKFFRDHSTNVSKSLAIFRDS